MKGSTILWVMEPKKGSGFGEKYEEFIFGVVELRKSVRLPSGYISVNSMDM